MSTRTIRQPATRIAVLPLAAIVIAAASVSLAMSFGTVLSAQEPNRIEGIGPLGPVEKIAGDFQFTEGPAVDDDGTLYFTDIPNERIHRWAQSDGLSTLLEPSGHANGLLWTAATGLIGCQMDGRVVAIDVTDGSVKVLAEAFEGVRFNAPNDLVVDSQGGIYFTDPLYLAPEPLPQGKMSVYYITPAGKVSRVVDSLPAPNGIVLSPDESVLYVIPSQDPQVRTYEVKSPGVLGEERIHCRLQLPEGVTAGQGGDGGTVDESGNLYVTTALGVQVIAPDGDRLGTIEFPEHPANVTFGGSDFRTLIVTARTSVYRVPLQVRGHRYRGAR